MDKDSKLRPLYLAKILYELTDEEHDLTTAQLIGLLEEQGISAHRETIKSEISLLQQMGLDIQEVKSTQNRYNLVSRLFDIPELKLLIDAVESSKFITKKKSEELVRKLMLLAGKYSAEELRRNLSVEGRLKPGNERIFIIVDTINRAINLGKKISFQYFSYNARKEQVLKHRGEPYVFTPLHLVWNGDFYYMVGLFEESAGIGCFRVDRIATCPEILEEDGDPAPDGFDIGEYLSTTFRMYNSEHRDVVLVCDASVMDSIIDRFGTDVQAEECGIGTVLVRASVAVSHVFYSWVFGFNGLVKIQAPLDVREEYKQMVLKAAEHL